MTQPEKCKTCDRPVLVTIYKGTGACGSRCAWIQRREAEGRPVQPEGRPEVVTPRALGSADMAVVTERPDIARNQVHFDVEMQAVRGGVQYGVEQPDGSIKPAPGITALMAAVSGERVRSEPECAVPEERQHSPMKRHRQYRISEGDRLDAIFCERTCVGASGGMVGDPLDWVLLYERTVREKKRLWEGAMHRGEPEHEIAAAAAELQRWLDILEARYVQNPDLRPAQEGT